jgi:hypothetical protein
VEAEKLEQLWKWLKAKIIKSKVLQTEINGGKDMMIRKL